LFDTAFACVGDGEAVKCKCIASPFVFGDHLLEVAGKVACARLSCTVFAICICISSDKVLMIL
jgi:hypothetical protein